MTVAELNSQLLKGVLSTLVLSLLAETESYGYELVTRLRSAGLRDIGPGTVYPVLSRLERDGLAATWLVASGSGPARKYYRLTDAGDAALTRGLADWERLTAVVRAVGAGRTASMATRETNPERGDQDAGDRE